MGQKTSIEWTRGGGTWNPIRARNRQTGKVGWYCVKQSPACENCYAERFNGWVGTGIGYRAQDLDKVEVFLDERILEMPLRTRRPSTYFLSSTTDIFGDFVTDEWLNRVFAVMALCPQHTFIVLTKRSARMRAYITDRIEDGADAVRVMLTAHHAPKGNWCQSIPWPLPNVWLMVTAEDQRRANERIPDLLATAAVIRGVSMEPLLGPVDLTMVEHDVGMVSHIDVLTGRHRFSTPAGREWGKPGSIAKLDWVIAGGESGPDARPSHSDWFRNLRDQCEATGVAFHFKQWGEWIDEANATRSGLAPGPEMFDRFGNPKGPKWHPYEASDRNGGAMIRVGKRAAGRHLDGILHDGYPVPASAGQVSP